VDKLAKQAAAKVKLLLTWIKGASHIDLSFLLNFNALRDYLKVYNDETREVSVAPADTPWPLIWMLVRYSRKHIWCSKKTLDLKLFHHHVLAFGHKLRWGWVFRNEESRALPFRVPHVSTAPCRLVIDAAIEAWIAKLQRVI